MKILTAKDILNSPKIEDKDLISEEIPGWLTDTLLYCQLEAIEREYNLWNYVPGQILEFNIATKDDIYNEEYLKQALIDALINVCHAKKEIRIPVSITLLKVADAFHIGLKYFDKETIIITVHKSNKYSSILTADNTEINLGLDTTNYWLKRLKNTTDDIASGDYCVYNASPTLVYLCQTMAEMLGVLYHKIPDVNTVNLQFHAFSNKEIKLFNEKDTSLDIKIVNNLGDAITEDPTVSLIFLKGELTSYTDPGHFRRKTLVLQDIEDEEIGLRYSGEANDTILVSSMKYDRFFVEAIKPFLERDLDRGVGYKIVIQTIMPQKAFDFIANCINVLDKGRFIYPSNLKRCIKKTDNGFSLDLNQYADTHNEDYYNELEGYEFVYINSLTMENTVTITRLDKEEGDFYITFKGLSSTDKNFLKKRIMKEATVLDSSAQSETDHVLLFNIASLREAWASVI